MQENDGVVKLTDHRFVSPGNLALIMERLPGSDLFNSVNDLESAINEDMVHCLFKQVLVIVIEFRKLAIVHRDIRNENLVFDDTDHPN